MKSMLFNRKNKTDINISIEKGYILNPLLCLLLSILLAFSSVVTYFADDNISSSERIVRLTTKGLDGNFTNNDDINKNKYELEIQKTLNSFNELCVEYTINEFSTAEDIASEIEIVMNNVSFKNALLTTSDTNTILKDPSIIINGNTTKLIINLDRDYVATLDKVAINIPFKITSLSDSGDIVLNLKSASSRIISYTWDTVLVDTIEKPEDLSEFDRFNNGTYFKNQSMKTAKGLYHTIPVRVLSKSNENETLIILEQPAFYFKNYDGTWTQGRGVQKMDSMTALTAKVIDFPVFQVEDTTIPMKLKVNNTSLTSAMKLEQTRIILDTSATLSEVNVEQNSNIEAVLKLETPFTANNSFTIDVNADMNKFDFNLIQSDIADDNQSILFSIPYKTKKPFNSGIVSLDIVTEFNGTKHNIISKDLTISSKEEDTSINPKPEVKDYYIGSLPSIAPLKNGMSKNSSFNIINNSNESTVIKVKIESSDSSVTLESDYLGFNIENDTEYIVIATVDANSNIVIPYTINTSKTSNTGLRDKINTLTFSIMTPDTIIDNNIKTLSYIVTAESENSGENPSENPAIIDYYIEELPMLSPVKNGDRKDSFFILVNSSNKDTDIKVKLTSSNTKVKIHSIHAGFTIEGENEYAITANVKANTTVKIPYTLLIGDTANTSTQDKRNTITIAIITSDDVITNNTKELSYNIKPKEPEIDNNPDLDNNENPIYPSKKDYYIGSLLSIVPLSNGASKNSTFNIVNNSDENASIQISIKSLDEKVNITSTHVGFSKLNSNEYLLKVDVDANSSVMVPYSISVSKTANTETTEKINTLTFSILTTDDITENNIKTLSHIIIPDKFTSDDVTPPVPDPDDTQKPTPNPDDNQGNNPGTESVNLNEYFNIGLLIDKTPSINQELTVAISATQIKNLENIIKNPKVVLTVTGIALKDYPTNVYTKTKDLSHLDISTLSAQSISFTPTAEGVYTVTAKIIGENLTSDGYLYAAKQLSISSAEGIPPNEPIIGSGKVFVAAELENIRENEAALKVIVSNNSEYLLRNASITISYDDPVTIEIIPTRSIVKDFYIGNFNKNTEREFTFPVKINRTGKPNISVTLNSTDLNLDVYTPKDSYNSTVTYVKKQEDAEKKYKISGIIFDDKNEDGLYSSNDQPISSATVNLKGKVGNIIQTMFSYTSGYYSFSGLMPGNYTIEVSYMGITTKKNITITNIEQLNINIPLLHSSNSSGSNGNGNTNNGGDNSNGNNSNGNTNNGSHTLYRDVSITGELTTTNGNNSYLVNLQINSNDALAVADAKLRITATDCYIQSGYDYIEPSTNSYIITVPSFINTYKIPIFFSVDSNKIGNIAIELECQSDINSTNNVISFILHRQDISKNNNNVSIIKGILRKKIMDNEIIVKVKGNNESYKLSSDVTFELNDEKSSAQKINRIFEDDTIITIKLYQNANSEIYKVLAESDGIMGLNSVNKNLIDFNTPMISVASTNELSTKSDVNAKSSKIVSKILPISQSNLETSYSSSVNIPSLPKTGETSLLRCTIYQVTSFITGLLSIILFFCFILLCAKKYLA